MEQATRASALAALAATSEHTAERHATCAQPRASFASVRAPFASVRAPFAHSTARAAAPYPRPFAGPLPLLAIRNRPSENLRSSPTRLRQVGQPSVDARHVHPVLVAHVEPRGPERAGHKLARPVFAYPDHPGGLLDPWQVRAGALPTAAGTSLGDSIARPFSLLNDPSTRPFGRVTAYLDCLA